MGNTTAISRLSNTLNSARRRHNALLGGGCPKQRLDVLIGDGGKRDVEYHPNTAHIRLNKKVCWSKDVYTSPNPKALLAFVKKNCLK
jgi:hypothetical protein